MIVGLVAAAQAADGSLEIRVGARGAADGTVEQHTEYADPEAAGMVGVLGEVHHAWDSGPWLGLTGFAYGYGPEDESSLLEITPAAGMLWDIGPVGHADAGVRASLDAAPFHPEADSVRVEAFGDAGATRGAHRIEAVFTAIDRHYLSDRPFSFSMGEAGGQWTWRPGAVHLRLRATFEGNATQGTDSVSVFGTQARGDIDVGGTAGRWDLDATARLIVGFGGVDEDLLRPQFSPSGVYLDDVDALSEGGQRVGRLDLSALGALGRGWALDTHVVLRLRQDEADDGVIAVTHTIHGQVDVSRAIGSKGVALTAGAGLTAVDAPALFDPSGWIGLRWVRVSRPTDPP